LENAPNARRLKVDGCPAEKIVWTLLPRQ
jgi:hypothetical protein